MHYRVILFIDLCCGVWSQSQLGSYRYAYDENFNPKSNTEAQIKIFVKRQLWPSLMSIKLYEIAPANSANQCSCLQYQPEMTESLFWQDATNLIWVLFPRRWGSKTGYESKMKNWICSMSNYMKWNQNSVWDDVPTYSYWTIRRWGSKTRYESEMKIWICSISNYMKWNLWIGTQWETMSPQIAIEQFRIIRWQSGLHPCDI